MLGHLKDRASLRRSIVIAIVGVSLVAYLRLVLRAPRALGIADWDMNFAYEAFVQRSLTHYRQLPLWTPYHSGGLPFFANPQTKVFSLAEPVALATGAVVGLKLEIFVQYLVGILGTYAYARQLNLRRFAALFAAAVYIYSGMLAMSVAVGMVPFLAAAFIPWFFLCFERANTSWRYAVAAGACLALMILYGGVHLVALTAFSVALLAVARVVARRALLRDVTRTLGIAFTSAFGLSAFKLIPMIELMRRLPRVRSEYSGYSLESIVHSLLTPNQDFATPTLADVPGFYRGMSWGPDENGMYVGIVVVALVMLGFSLYTRRDLAFAVLFVILVWLSFGDRAPVSLWAWLRRLPVFESMRVAQRFRFVWMLLFAVLAGAGLQAIHDWLVSRTRSRRLGAVVAVSIAVVAVVNLFSNAKVYALGLSVPSPPMALPGDFRQIERLPLYGPTGWEQPESGPTPLNAWSAQYPAVMQNLGTIQAYEPIADDFSSRVRPSTSPMYRGEVYLAKGQGSVQLVKWSPNRIVVDVLAAQNDSLVFNQNFFPGWRSTVGSVVDANGHLSVPVSPGHQRVEVFYRPSSVVIGAVVTALSLVAVALALIRSRLRTAQQLQQHEPRSGESGDGADDA
jgi:hypothetical protein